MDQVINNHRQAKDLPEFLEKAPCFRAGFEASNKSLNAMKKYIERKFNVKLESLSEKKDINARIAKIKWAVNLLLSVGEKLPDARRDYLRTLIQRELAFLESVQGNLTYKKK